MHRARIVASVVGVAGMSFGLSTAQAAPAVLDRVPDQAMVVIGIGSPDQAQKNLSALGQAVQASVPIPTVEDLLAMGGMGPSVDATKGMALVFFAPTPEKLREMADKAKAAGEGGGEGLEAFGAQPDSVILVPVKNYGEFVQALTADGKPAGAADAKDGVNTVTLPGGVPGFARDVGGGYAVLGIDQARVASFTGKSGDKALKGRLGKAGDALADGADLFTIVNVEQIRPLVPVLIEQAKKAAAEQAEMMGQDAANMERQMASMTWVLETLTRDADVAVGSVRFSATGIAGDMNVRLNEGSYLGKAFAQGGKPGTLLGALPNQSFLLAGAIDTSLAGMKALWTDFSKQAAGPNDAMLAAGIGSVENASGQAVVIGVPIAGLMSGLLTQSVSYVASPNPGAFAAQAKSGLLAMNGTEQNGAKINVTYTDGGAKVGETPVDVYEAKIVPGDNDEAMMAAQGLAMMFGPQGAPGGYLAKSDSGVYMTFTKNTDLMSRALGVSKNPEQSLQKDAGIAATGGNLPSNRIAEAYWGVRPTLDQTLPFLGMMGIQVPMEKIPETIPPVGASIASDDGQARFSFFVPAPVIKAGLSITEAFMDQMGGQNDPQDGQQEPGQPGRTGQPRF